MDAKKTRLEELMLTKRAWNALIYANLRTVDDLLRLSAGDLMRLHGIGEKSLRNIIERLSAHGMELARHD